jgi:hypothetical protein
MVPTPTLREACAVAFRMSLDETSVARSIVGNGLDETWRSHVYGQPASCTALPTYSALQLTTYPRNYFHARSYSG